MADEVCPRCKIALGSVEDKEISFLGCSKCYGLFVSDPDLIAYVEKAASPRAFAAFIELRDKMLASATPGQIRHCPLCKTALKRHTIGENPLVVLDRCEDHGIWLDRGELKKVIRTARAAGGQPHVEGEDDDEPDLIPKGPPAKGPPPKKK